MRQLLSSSLIALVGFAACFPATVAEIKPGGDAQWIEDAGGSVTRDTAGRITGVDLRASYMVGDRGTDVTAGRAAGCATLLVAGNDPNGRDARPDEVVADLAEAAAHILAHALAASAREDA